MWVQVSLQEWSALQHDSYVLSELRARGVDQWEGYDLAMQEINEERTEDE